MSADIDAHRQELGEAVDAALRHLDPGEVADLLDEQRERVKAGADNRGLAEFAQ